VIAEQVLKALCLLTPSKDANCSSVWSVQARPYLRTGQRGPGRGRQISRGGILKKVVIEVCYEGGKKAVHEREI
jgi:hypothetical protein